METVVEEVQRVSSEGKIENKQYLLNQTRIMI